jgi:hypothetical protein
LDLLLERLFRGDFLRFLERYFLRGFERLLRRDFLRFLREDFLRLLPDFDRRRYTLNIVLFKGFETFFLVFGKVFGLFWFCYFQILDKYFNLNPCVGIIKGRMGIQIFIKTFKVRVEKQHAM